jgi:hypothetical protein
MGACNDHSFEPEVLRMEVERRITTVNAGVTSDTWHEIAEADLNIDEMYVFHSNLPAASYRARLRPMDDIVEHYTYAVAFNKTPGLSRRF